MLFKTLLILMLSGTSSLYLLNFHGTRVDRKGLLSTFMCLEIFVKLFLDLVRCSTFTSLPRIDVCGWQNFWKLDTLAVIKLTDCLGWNLIMQQKHGNSNLKSLDSQLV